jgi:hypothetical protein
MAAYPNTTKVYTSKENIADLVDAAHVNELQQEVIAVEETLGVNPHISGAGAGAFTTVKLRLDYLDVNKSQITHGHTHGDLGGRDADDHSLYLTNGRHDNTVRHAYGNALAIPGTPSTSVPGDTAAPGDSPAPARGNHRHAREAIGPAASPVGHMHTWRFSHSWLVVGDIRVPVGAADYIMGMYLPPTGITGTGAAKLVGLRYKLFSGGPATISLLRNGAAVTGLTGLSVTTVQSQTILGTLVALTNADELRPLVTAVAGTPVHMQMSVYVDYAA